MHSGRIMLLWQWHLDHLCQWRLYTCQTGLVIGGEMPCMVGNKSCLVKVVPWVRYGMSAHCCSMPMCVVSFFSFLTDTTSPQKKKDEDTGELISLCFSPHQCPFPSQSDPLAQLPEWCLQAVLPEFFSSQAELTLHDFWFNSGEHLHKLTKVMPCSFSPFWCTCDFSGAKHYNKPSYNRCFDLRPNMMGTLYEQVQKCVWVWSCSNQFSDLLWEGYLITHPALQVCLW